jgi:hypothetical protein
MKRHRQVELDLPVTVELASTIRERLRDNSWMPG